MTLEQIDPDKLRAEMEALDPDDLEAVYIFPHQVLALLDQIDQAEARIRSVRDVLDTRTFEPFTGPAHVTVEDLRRALDGDAL